jgi:hypothetical protein
MEWPPRLLHWFVIENQQTVAFKTADAYLDVIDGKQTVGFVNGRHRTRWLIDHRPLILTILGSIETQLSAAFLYSNALSQGTR